MAFEKRIIAATALAFAAALMQGCNKTVRDQDWEGTSQLNTSWRTPNMAGYEDASEFCKLPWSYSDQKYWADIEGSKCGNVGDQAPIALDDDPDHIIDNTSVEDENHRLGPPQWIKGTTKLGVVQTTPDHTWGFDIIGGQAGITWKGKLYNMTNFHLHSPSEHTLDLHDAYNPQGPERYAAEMHFVNTAADGSVLVVCLLYVIDKTDPHLSKLAYDIGAIRQGDIPVNSTKKQIVENPYHWPLTRYGIESYYTYEGSHATPPCETGVEYMVMLQPAMMDMYQLSQYRGAMQAASCDSLPSSRKWVDADHANPRGAPPNCNGAQRMVMAADGTWSRNDTEGHALPNCNPTPYRTHCSMLAKLPVLGQFLPCPFWVQHQSWFTYPKWNYSSNAGENNRELQPVGSNRKVYKYVTPMPISLQIIEAIFLCTVTKMIWAIYWDRQAKQRVKDVSLRTWFNEIGRTLDEKTQARLDSATQEQIDEAHAEIERQKQRERDLNAREPDDADAGPGARVAPSDAAQPLLAD